MKNEKNDETVESPDAEIGDFGNDTPSPKTRDNSLTEGSRFHGLLQGISLEDINRRKDNCTNRTGLDGVGQASLLVGPTPGVDVKEHWWVRLVWENVPSFLPAFQPAVSNDERERCGCLLCGSHKTQKRATSIDGCV